MPMIPMGYPGDCPCEPLRLKAPLHATRSALQRRVPPRRRRGERAARHFGAQEAPGNPGGSPGGIEVLGEILWEVLRDVLRGMSCRDGLRAPRPCARVPGRWPKPWARAGADVG